MPAKSKRSAKTTTRSRSKKTAKPTRSAGAAKKKRNAKTAKPKQAGKAATKKRTASTKRKYTKKKVCEQPIDDRVGRSCHRDSDDKVTEFSSWELISAVMDILIKGTPVQKIVTEMKAKYGEAGIVNRQRIYDIMKLVAEKKHLKYHAPPQAELAHRIRGKFRSWLKEVDVVRTTVVEHVAQAAAALLLQLVQECHDANPEKDEVHVGLAAGMSMRLLAEHFAGLLWHQHPDLPKRIVFHAMLSGSEPGNPTTDPNAFFTFFMSPEVLVIEPQFMGLRAPAVMETDDIPQLKKTHDIKEAYEAAKKLDIIATSGADWDDEHSSLQICMKRNQSSYDKLIENGTICDMMWRPLSAQTPVTIETETRALTLMELTDLPAFLKKGKVLCMLGPCAKCNRTKGRLLGTILGQREHLISHLVCDSRTAREYLSSLKDAKK